MHRALCVVLLAAGGAWADSQEGVPVATSQVDGVPGTPRGAERSFLFIQDPNLPEPGHTLVSAGLGNVTRTGEQRPLGTGPILPSVEAEVGILPRLSAYAAGGMAFAQPGGSASPSFAVEAGAHFLVTQPSSRGFHLAFQAGVGRDLSAAPLVRLNGTLGWDLAKARLAVSLSASRDFRAGTDGVDLSGVVAASYALPWNLRAGAELVAQDLEELAVPGSEGGMTAFAGPTLGWQWGKRFGIVAGPAVGITSGVRTVLARGVATLQL